MTFKVYDYSCGACGNKQERMVHKNEINNQYCDKCEHPMHKDMPAPSGSGNCAHGYMAKVRGGNHAK